MSEKQFLKMLEEAGVTIKSMEDLLVLDVDWNVVEAVSKKYLTHNTQDAIAPTLFRVRRMIKLGRDVGFPKARSIVNKEMRDNRKIAAKLRPLGIHISSIYDLVNTSKPYPEAIPVLIELLSEIESPMIKEGLVRALTVKYGGAELLVTLLEEYKKCNRPKFNEHSLCWAIANAISEVAIKTDYDKVVSLLSDKTYGKARQPLILYLKRYKFDNAGEILIELLDDEDVFGYAIVALGKIKVKNANAIPKLRDFLNHPHGPIRKESAGAIAKIEKSIQQSSER